MTYLKIFFILFIYFVLSDAKISDKRLCANPECSEPISYAKTLLRYHSDDKQILSFPANVDVIIYSKSAGSRSNLWGAVINGKRGYVPISHIRETKILKKNPEHLLSTEDLNDSTKKTVSNEEIAPNSVAQPHEVIEGTTIYFNSSGHDDLSHTTPNPVAPITNSQETEHLEQHELDDKKIDIKTEQISDVKETKQENPNTNIDVKTEEVSKNNDNQNVQDDEEDDESAEVEDYEGDDEEDEDDDDDEEETEQIIENNLELNTSFNSSPEPNERVTVNAINEQLSVNIKAGKNEELNEATNKLDVSHKVPSETPNSLDQVPDNKLPSSSFSPTESITINELPTTTEQINVEMPLPFIQPEESPVTNVPVTEKEEIILQNSNTNIEVNNKTVLETEPMNENKIEPIIESTPSTDNSVNSDQILHETKPIIKEIVTEKNESVNNFESVIENIITDKSIIDEEPVMENIKKELETVNENIVTSDNNESVIKEVETSEDISNENENEGFFSKVYTNIFGSSGDEPLNEDKSSNEDNVESSGALFSSNQNVVEENLTEEVVENVQISNVEEKVNEMAVETTWDTHTHETPADKYLSAFNEHTSDVQSGINHCNLNENPSGCIVAVAAAEAVTENKYTTNPEELITNEEDGNELLLALTENTYNIFFYLILTAITVLLFSLGHYYIEMKRKDTRLVSHINNLEKKLLISTKECLLLHDELKEKSERFKSVEDSSFGSNEMVTSLKNELELGHQAHLELEEHNANLEKELENATEAGIELNRMLEELLSSQTGNEFLMKNVEHLQMKLNEQQITLNNMNTNLNTKMNENESLQNELLISNEKITELQTELDKMVVNLISVQEEKSKIENNLEQQQIELKTKFQNAIQKLKKDSNVLTDENKQLKQMNEQIQNALDLKTNEYVLLKEGMNDIKNNKEALKTLLDVSTIKAEVQQLRDEKRKLYDKINNENEAKTVLEKEVQVMLQEVKNLKEKFEEANREKVEAQTRLEVLSTYFKQKETELQKEINQNESKWLQKEGEATSTIERIKWIQEELQNYKSQNEVLKKEILDQEVSLKSQISLLEKKSHDNWVLARQAERRVDESKQEASQLRNRLTIVEKNLNNSNADESKLQNRIMSPLESNGELPITPLHMANIENPGSPPLFSSVTSPALPPPPPGMPPFMPPPPGVPFMPPPIPGVPPFMPPPRSLFPGDHRPPPLGRMSSPPLHGRYSPDSRAYSPYDQDDSPPLSPTYTDSDYRRRSPGPPPRNYSPYASGKGRNSHWDDGRDYRTKPHNRNRKGQGLSSGSGNSNESLDNSGRHSNRV